MRKDISDTFLPHDLSGHLILHSALKSVNSPKLIIEHLELLLLDLSVVTLCHLTSWLSRHYQLDTTVIIPWILHLLFYRLRVLRFYVFHPFVNVMLMLAFHKSFEGLLLHVSFHHVENEGIFPLNLLIKHLNNLIFTLKYKKILPSLIPSLLCSPNFLLSLLLNPLLKLLNFRLLLAFQSI